MDTNNITGRENKRGAPYKLNGEYYPHSKHLSQDLSIKALDREFGANLGYAYYTKVLELLTGSNNFEIELNKDNILTCSKYLNISEKRFKRFIDFAIKEGINALSLSEKSILFSIELLEIRDKIMDKRERDRLNQKNSQHKKTNDYNNEYKIISSDKSLSNGIISELSEHSRVDKSIEENNKIENIIYKENEPNGVDIPIIESINFESYKHLNNKSFCETWKRYKKYRVQMKKELPGISEEENLKYLCKYEVSIAIKMIEQTIKNSWISIQEVNENSFKATKNEVVNYNTIRRCNKCNYNLTDGGVCYTSECVNYAKQVKTISSLIPEIINKNSNN